jgi:hypothetical protein
VNPLRRQFFRLWLLILMAGSVVVSYRLGWTNTYLPEEDRIMNSWAARNVYANQGLDSLLHFSPFSIVMGTSLVVLPLVVFWMLRNHRKTADGWAVEDLLKFIILLLLCIFILVRPDVPNNYYASRYFLFALFPAIYILFGMFVESRSQKGTGKWVVYALLSFGLTFNLYYSINLYAQPVFQNRFDTLGAIAARIPPSSHLFLEVDDFSNRLLFLPLRYLAGIEVTRIQGDFEASVNAYGLMLGLEEAYLLSTTHRPEGESLATIHLDDERHPWSILYPTSVNSRRLTYYLWKKNFAAAPVRRFLHTDLFGEPSRSGTLVLGRNVLGRVRTENFYVDSIWSTGIVEVDALDDAFDRAADRIRIVTGGNWLRHDPAPSLTVIVDGNEIRPARSGNLFEAVLDSPRVIRSLRVLSSTFVPSEIGINEDPRSLGVDILAIHVLAAEENSSTTN